MFSNIVLVCDVGVKLLFLYWGIRVIGKTDSVHTNRVLKFELCLVDIDREEKIENPYFN